MCTTPALPFLPRSQPIRQQRLLPALLLALWCCGSCCGARTFEVKDDLFIADGDPVQINSGSLHYNRIHPAYWQDRLARARSLGLNAVQTYVPWNLHEPYPGQYSWSGFADLEGFLHTAQDTGLLVILRPGPYICAEMDWGGLPFWLASNLTAGGNTMKLRTSDPAYLAHVDRWWAVLLPKMAPYMYHNGGPIIMVQVENEYGFFGPDQDYIRHLVSSAKAALGSEAVIFTTDPPDIVANGTLPGSEVYSVVDFPPGTNVTAAFQAQAGFNPPGQSPPFCSEFYTGWLTHWGEKMANTSAEALLATFKEILAYGNGSGSVNLYMAHGGSSFGFTSGGGVSGTTYRPQLTSYDYSAPISEAGDTGQPGIGGINKFELLRTAIKEHTGIEPRKRLPPPRIVALGTVSMVRSIALLYALPALYPGDGIASDRPLSMEDLGQGHGVTVYRTWLPSKLLRSPAILDLAAPVHDYAQVLLDGRVVSQLNRSHPANVTLPSLSTLPLTRIQAGSTPQPDRPNHAMLLPRKHPTREQEQGNADHDAVQLDIVVHAMGRDSTASFFDRKGLSSPDVRINGEVWTGWRMFPLPLNTPAGVPFPTAGPAEQRQHNCQDSHSRLHASHKQQQQERCDEHQVDRDMRPNPLSGWWVTEQLWRVVQPAVSRLHRLAQHIRVMSDTYEQGTTAASPDPAVEGPVFIRGTFDINSSQLQGHEHPPDTYLDLTGWGKGLAYINGFNLGWYWPAIGPQMTHYIPGPVLQEGLNEVVLLEFARVRSPAEVELTSEPNFFGPA